MNSVLEGEAWLMFVLGVDNEQRKENEFWFDQFIWWRVVDSETAGLELMIKGLLFARQQIAFMNQEDTEPAARAEDYLLHFYP